MNGRVSKHDTNKPLVDAIHIGFPKTATTWLQTKIIPQIEGVISLGKPYLVEHAYRDALNEFTGCSSYDFSPERFHDAFRSLEQKNREKFSGGRKRLMSFELLSGEIYGGRDSKELIDRIYATFGKVRIIITIREQRAMIESVYRHYVSGGGGLHIRELLYKTMSPSVDVFGNQHLFDKFRYDKIIRYCQRLFGSEKVHVLLYEKIVRGESDAFVTDFLTALGIGSQEIDVPEAREHSSLSYAGTNVLRFVNQIVCTPLSDSPFLRSLSSYYYRAQPRLMLPVDRLVFARIFPTARFIEKKRKWVYVRLAKRILGRYDVLADGMSIADHIAEAYAESNAATAALTGIELANYGYATASLAAKRDSRTAPVSRGPESLEGQTTIAEKEI